MDGCLASAFTFAALRRTGSEAREIAPAVLPAGLHKQKERSQTCQQKNQ